MKRAAERTWPQLAVTPSEALLVAAIMVVAVLLRIAGFGNTGYDMGLFSDWYRAFLVNGRWHALSLPVGNYNAPFLYLLDGATFLPFSPPTNIKLVFVAFDVLLVYFVYRIVALRYRSWHAPFLAAAVVALLPTVVMNASLWGQADSMWASFGVGSIYYLLRRRHWPACVLAGVALAIKPQAIVLLALLLLLALAGRLPWRATLAVPLVYLVLDLPAVFAGRSPRELLQLYSWQTSLPYLTFNAPSVYQFLPGSGADGGLSEADEHLVANLARFSTVAAILIVCFAVVAGRLPLGRTRVLLAASLFALLIPFLLPSMHERYFYFADILTVVVAFYRPNLWYVPLLVQTSSALSYVPYLFHPPPERLVDFRILTTLMLAAILAVGCALLRGLPHAAIRSRRAPAVPSEPVTVAGAGGVAGPEASSTAVGVAATLDEQPVRE
jgi:Gpi18-like mannosyltransferase